MTWIRMLLDRYDLIALRMDSKWELRRLCQAVGATPLVVRPPTSDTRRNGILPFVTVQHMGGKPVTVFFQNTASKLATTVLQAAKDGCYVYRGGSVEMALSVWLQQEAEKVPGLEQYALAAFGKALQVIPRTLAENAGWDPTRVLADLQATHAASDEETICSARVDIEGFGEDDKNGTPIMKESAVHDLLINKLSALRLAVDAATTILKIDQIIMSKPSGGPKGWREQSISIFITKLHKAHALLSSGIGYKWECTK